MHTLQLNVVYVECTCSVKQKKKNASDFFALASGDLRLVNEKALGDDLARVVRVGERIDEADLGLDAPRLGAEPGQHPAGPASASGDGAGVALADRAPPEANDGGLARDGLEVLDAGAPRWRGLSRSIDRRRCCGGCGEAIRRRGSAVRRHHGHGNAVHGRY